LVTTPTCGSTFDLSTAETDIADLRVQRILIGCGKAPPSQFDQTTRNIPQFARGILKSEIGYAVRFSDKMSIESAIGRREYSVDERIDLSWPAIELGELSEPSGRPQRGSDFPSICVCSVSAIRKIGIPSTME
jgi:hypothetical protein